MDERLRLATELGADHTINAAANDPVQAILDLTGGQGATASLETSGNPTARQQTLSWPAPLCPRLATSESAAPPKSTSTARSSSRS